MSISRLVLLATALLAALAYHVITVSRLEQDIHDTQHLLQQVKQDREAYQAALAHVQDTLNQVRDQYQREVNARDAAQRQAQQLEADYAQAKRQLLQLSQQDEAVGRWGRQPVPAALVERLQPSASRAESNH